MLDSLDVCGTVISSRDAGPPTGREHDGSSLLRLIYRSQATQPLSGAPLAAMMQEARQRNHRMGVTGLLVADGKRYLQWLEGPAGGVQSLMRSISLDRRHDSIEVLAETSADVRAFKGWDMRLASDHASVSLPLPSLEIPAPLVDSLWRQSTQTPELMATLGAAAPRAYRQRVVEDGLRSVYETRMRGSQRPAPARNADLDRLIRSLLGSEPVACGATLAECGDVADADVWTTFVAWVEPAARRLGDLWLTDDVSDLDLTIALGRLQVFVHQLAQATAWVRPQPAAPHVLVASLPGEAHSLSAVLDMEWLWLAGWMPSFDIPRTDEALEQRLHNESFDLLDLSLSPVFERRDQLGDLRHRLIRFRAASRNPDLAIRVAGRVFPEHQLLAGLVGADAVGRSCHLVDRQLARLVTRPLDD